MACGEIVREIKRCSIYKGVASTDHCYRDYNMLHNPYCCTSHMGASTALGPPSPSSKYAEAPQGPSVFAAKQALRSNGPMHDSMMRMLACTFQLSPSAGLTSSYPANQKNTLSYSTCQDSAWP